MVLTINKIDSLNPFDLLIRWKEICMEIRHLKTFKTIVDLGGFTKAAENLGYAQSTITFHMKAIEAELGQPVFDRIGKKVFLTETGRHLLPHAIKMLKIYRDLKGISAEDAELKGEIVISAPEALLIYRLPQVIKEYKERCPKVNIQLKHLVPANLINEITDGDVDIALVIDKEKNEEDIQFKKLVTEQMMLISPASSCSTPTNFINPIYLVTEKGCSYRNMFEKLLYEKNQEDRLEQKEYIEFWSIDAIKQCIICGFGVSLLPYITVKDEINQGRISAQEVDSSEKLATYLCYHKDKWLSPSLRVFLEIIHEHAKDWRKESFLLMNKWDKK